MRHRFRTACRNRYFACAAVISAFLVVGLSPALLAQENGRAVIVAAEGSGQAAARMLFAQVSPDWDWEPAVQPINRPVFLAPEPVEMVVPGYPAGQVRDGYQGVVIAEGTITPQGWVREGRIVRTPAEGIFDQAVLEALAQWRFRAAIRDGVPVEVTGIFTFKFEIN